MSAATDFYRARAVQCARDASQSSLVNVRERNLRAEAAWLAMAERSQGTETARLRQAAEKADQREDKGE